MKKPDSIIITGTVVATIGFMLIGAGAILFFSVFKQVLMMDPIHLLEIYSSFPIMKPIFENIPDISLLLGSIGFIQAVSGIFFLNGSNIARKLLNYVGWFEYISVIVVTTLTLKTTRTIVSVDTQELATMFSGFYLVYLIFLTLLICSGLMMLIHFLNKSDVIEYCKKG